MPDQESDLPDRSADNTRNTHNANNTDLLTTLLRDVVTRGDAYVVGEPDAAVRRLLSEHGVEGRPAHRGAEPLPLVLALGGLDDFALAEHLTWDEACDEVAALLAPGGTLVLGHPVESTLASLLTAAPSTTRPDPDRPASAPQLRAALAGAGLRGTTVHLLFGSADSPRAILTEQAARQARPGSLPALLVESAVVSAANGSRTLLSPADAIDRASQAGALEIASAGLIAVVGGRGRDVYAGEGPETIWAERSGDGRSWVLSDRSVPNRPSVEAELRALLAASDVTAFRELAQHIGSFVRTDPRATSVDSIDLHRLVREADGRISWVFPAEQAPGADADSDRLIAGAWRTFLHRLGYRRDMLPWPPNTDDDGLVSTWMRMSGVESEGYSSGHTVPPNASQQAEALAGARDRAQVDFARERLDLTRAALDRRESQLTVRETTVRMLRQQLVTAQEDKLKAEMATAALRSGAAYKLSRRITLLQDPKGLVQSVGNRLDTSVKKIRRMR